MKPLKNQLKVLLLLYHRRVMATHITRDIYDILIFEMLISHGDIKEAMVIASSLGKLNWVKYLIGHRADVNSCMKECMNSACSGGHLELVKYLVGRFYHYDLYNLCRAVEKGHLNIVRYLVEEKRVDYTEDSYAPRRAVETGHLHILKYFIEERHYKHTNSCLVHACRCNQLEIIKYLVEIGSDVNYENGLLLHIACEYDHPMVVQTLVEKGADIHRYHYNYTYPIRQAFYYACMEIIKYLVEKGANVFTVRDDDLDFNLYKGKTEVVKYILEEKFKDHRYKPDCSGYGRLKRFIEKTF